MKGPLTDALQQYRDGPDGLDEAQTAYKRVWNEVQKEVSLENSQTEKNILNINSQTEILKQRRIF